MMYFEFNEFDSPDEIGSGEKMQATTLKMLDETRRLAGFAFVVTSGYRTKHHNDIVGGVKGSSHTKGYAVDIRCRKGNKRFRIIDAALKAGFNRIGVSKNFIHLDNDPDKSENVIWTY